MLSEKKLLAILQDGCFHSGSELGKQLNLSRTAVWKHVNKIEKELGITVQAVKGRGYRIPGSIELLDRELIVGKLEDSAIKLLSKLDIKLVVDSTNHYLMQQVVENYDQAYVVIAEKQTAGKGRRGRKWVSPFAQNIYLSILWRFKNAPLNLSAMSLVAGTVVAQTLERMGYGDIRLKWPNDIYCQGKKLGGFLLELKGESGGACSMVIGLGLNVNMVSDEATEIDQEWIDINSLSSISASRNLLVSHILSRLLPAIRRFSQCGFDSFIPEWQRFDMLKDRQVTVLMDQEKREGIARGINNHGALIFESKGITESIFAGEVSLRLNDK